ncbi:MAG: helix-hairpin-helix domain-containing protein, partial [Candidatus Adiutrix sp.]|nr:helix-hairpin-helix domain-containing protein [Candidatus Adiutrix sp.]
LPPPPDLPAGPAAYRPDGGQSLGPAGSWPPNALTRLNLGHRVDLKTTPARLLAALPGLGPKTAEKARAGGCLDRRARAALKNLVNETCARNSR